MLRQAPRILARHNAPILRTFPPRRLFTTAPPSQTSRSWKNSAVRWSLAIGLVYWYNTSNLFAEEAAFPISQPLSPTEETNLPTVDDIARARQRQKQADSSQRPPPQDPSQQSTASPTLSSTEEEAHQEGAFNEETGEINWDCPCLGGMAHGPCGVEFKAAFSCFVYSKEEPKGMECIENFKGMQDCFRAHPDIYGEELEAQEGDVQEELEEREREREREQGLAGAEDTGRGEGDASTGPTMKSTGGFEPSTDEGPSTSPLKEREGGVMSEKEGDDTERAKAAKEQVEKEHGEPTSESEEIVPKAAHDAR